MRVCASEVIAILLATLACFGEKCFCVSSEKAGYSPTPSFDSNSNVSSGNVLTTTVQPDVHLASDNKTDTFSTNVAHLSVGNKSELAVNSNDSSNDTEEAEDSTANVTSKGRKKSINFFHNRGAMLRAFYVAAGILVILTVYTFVVSRLKKRKTKRHKYSRLTKHTEVELTPLGQDNDEDDEHTVFDAVQYKS